MLHDLQHTPKVDPVLPVNVCPFPLNEQTEIRLTQEAIFCFLYVRKSYPYLFPVRLAKVRWVLKCNIHLKNYILLYSKLESVISIYRLNCNKINDYSLRLIKQMISVLTKTKINATICNSGTNSSPTGIVEEWRIESYSTLETIFLYIRP